MFEFWSKNIINTTTMITVTSNSNESSKKNIFDSNRNTKWMSSNEGAIGTYSIISIRGLDPSQTLSGIFLLNYNCSKIWVTYNSNTFEDYIAGGYYLSQTGDPLKRNSYIHIQGLNPYSTIGLMGIHTLNFRLFPDSISTLAENYIGGIIISAERKVRFDPPSSNNFKQIRRSIGIKRQLSDGGIINNKNSDKFSCDINLTKINSTTLSSLTSIWKENTNFIFIPFPPHTCPTFKSQTISEYTWLDTSGASWPYDSTSIENIGYLPWDGKLEQVVWTNDLDIENYIDNNLSNGYSGRITLNQIPD